MALTAAQITSLRQRTGDTNTANPNVDDATLDLDFTEAEEDLDDTTVLVLRRLVGIYATGVDQSLDLNSEQKSQRFKQTMQLLNMWEARTGDTGTLIKTGALDMNIDTDLADIT